jgi:glycosyltransferase involved in cell wall biosynthesis
MSRQQNILYVGTLPPYTGGSALSSAQLLMRFAARGHVVRAISPFVGDGVDEFSEAHPELHVERFPVPHFDFDHTKPRGEAYRREERVAIRERVRALIDEERPSILMTGRESFAPPVSDIAIEAGIPLVLRTAGGFSTELLDGTLEDALARDLRDAFRKAALIVSPAEHLARRLRDTLALEVTTIRNAVDLRMFAPRPKSRALLRDLEIDEDATVVLHASNLVTSKRPMDVVDSAAIVLRDAPEAVYVVLGEGPLRAAMEVACRERELVDRFRFVGWVGYELMPEYMNLADVFVLPAQWETQARVYLEAQACARFVLASDIAAAREVIVDGESGALHRVGDVEDLARQTLRIAGDAAWRSEVGRRARERVRRHDLDDAATAYLDQFARLTE